MKAWSISCTNETCLRGVSAREFSTIWKGVTSNLIVPNRPLRKGISTTLTSSEGVSTL